jgi:predicted naringenin-chalcone synthase
MIPTLYRLSGVRSRYSVLVDSSSNGEPARQSFYHVAASPTDLGPTTQERMRRYEADALDLAEAAARAAMADAGVTAAGVTHVITVSCSGFCAPGVDVGLVERLGLARNTVRTHIGFMGCHGAFNGLRLAGAFANADPAACVLVCCVELCSIHQQYTADAERLVANSLFADGAAAVVCQATPASPADWTVVDQQSYLLPDTANLMGWRIGDHGFEMTLSPQVPDAIGLHLCEKVEQWLATRNLTREDIRTWAIHPGGPRILLACCRALGLERSAVDTSREILAAFGNMSSSTILFILRQIRMQQSPLPCIALAFGPGLSIEAALVDTPR